MIEGKIRKEKGRIEVGDFKMLDEKKGIKMKKEKRRIGYVFKDERLFEYMRVKRKIKYERWEGKRKEKRRLDEVVEMIGIGNIIESRK